MPRLNGAPPRASSARVIAASVLLDVVIVVGFAALGRTSHARDATLGGLWETSWPFLAGLALSWLFTRAWRAPAAPLRTGLPLTAGTLVVGMLLRWVAGQGTALPFVLVATGTLALLLIGWRLIHAGVGRIRRHRNDRVAKP